MAEETPDGESLNELLQRLAQELRAIAGSMLNRERADHTLQPTALVHEAWLRMAASDQLRFPSESAFVAYAATAMRHILVDHARRRGADRRGGGRVRFDLNLDQLVFVDPATQAAEHGFTLRELDDELRLLESQDPVSAQAFVLRYFGGMEWDQVGDRLEYSGRRLQDLTKSARNWLLVRLDGPSREHIG